eukprot:c13991_g1_i1.p1 GENE.c13991_g1_i1~~c13991_g1_i1.p1  ORF type:complete len:524 (+),score=87.84 c13991_g1_i1:488-2059(+)
MSASLLDYGDLGLLSPPVAETAPCVDARPVEPSSERQGSCPYAIYSRTGLSYVPIRRLGEGTYGVVFHAVEREHVRHVAIKEIKWSQLAAPGSPEDVRLRKMLATATTHDYMRSLPTAFVHEISLLAKSAHPNVLEVRDIIVSSTSWATATDAAAAATLAAPATLAASTNATAEAAAAAAAVAAAAASTPTAGESGFDSSRLYVFLVTELAEGDASALLMERRRLGLGIPTEDELKSVLFDLLSALAHVHSIGIVHRDIKPANLLCFRDGRVKLCDFGLAIDAAALAAKSLASGASSSVASVLQSHSQGNIPVLRPPREKVSALWYRAPELLFGTRVYTSAIDLWGVGCCMAELLLGEPLFGGSSEAEQIKAMTYLLGGAHETIYPGVSSLPVVRRFSLGERLFRWHPYSYLRERISEPLLSEQGFDLLNRLLTYNPKYRVTAKKALQHPWFEDLRVRRAEAEAAAAVAAASESTVTAPPSQAASPVSLLPSRKRKAMYDSEDSDDESLACKRPRKRARVAEE